MTKKTFDIFKKSYCEDCLYYNYETGVCQKAHDKMTVFEWLFCEPHIKDKENENDIGRI